MKLSHEVKAALVTEMDVHQRDVRPEQLGTLQRLGRVHRHTYDGDPFTLEQYTRRIQKTRVVVDDKTTKHNTSITCRSASTHSR